MSTSLRLSGVSFAYGDDAPILDGVELHLTSGWTGVVGPNGAGKTTLLRLLEGSLEPRRGHIEREPRRLVTHLCVQRVDALDEAIQNFAWDWDKAAIRWRARLDLDPEAIERWSTLSPGERKRWQIAAALAREPDLLLLDEPTNHLDVEARATLAEALTGFEGIGLVVSHDRAFLDRLCEATLRVAHGTAELFTGGYSKARDTWTRLADARQARYESAKSAQRRVRRQLIDHRRNHEAAGRQLSAKARMKNAGDSDARSVSAKGRVQKAEAALARRVTAARSAAERALDQVSEAASQRAPKSLGRSLFVDWEPAPKRRLCELVADAIAVPGRTLIADLQLVVERDTRARLAGRNGSGKTTLLTELVKRMEASLGADRLLYLPQHLSPEAAEGLLSRLRELPRDARGEVLSMVAALGVDPDRLLATARPSPGEARKLAIAWGLGRRVWALVLDEPTNHLDLPSIQRLEEALADYPGALLLVSHDDAFAAKVARETWRIAENPDASPEAGCYGASAPRLEIE